jgi:glycerol-3-phosphate dehydrogenase
MGTFDLLVIGGGATGTGVALDAATRGLSVALVERDDFAAGTSSRSTKLIHGGVRYLEGAIKHLDRKEFRLVTDALHERKVLLSLAPHLTRPLPLVTPLYSLMDIPYYTAGLKLYDWISRDASLGASTFISAKEALRRFPLLKHEGLKGAVLYYDGQFNDARMNVAIALTAARSGATLHTHTEVIGLSNSTARCHNTLTGKEFEITAKTIINATGPFADAICKLDDPGHQPLIAPSSGVHIILDAKFSPPATGLLIPHTEDGRVLFLLPWENATLAGTTDEACEISDTPRPHRDEVDYILRHLNQTFDVQLDRSHVRAAWSGIRPLAREPDGKSTAQLARDHVITTSPSGLITIVGGKWTTYRRMAFEAVDKAIEVGKLSPTGPSQTETTLLEGAEGFTPQLKASLEAEFHLDHDIASHLTHCYGSHATHVLSQQLNDRLVPPYPFVEGEVVYAARHEMALTAIDLIARRLRLAFLDSEAARKALPRVVELMAPIHNWDAERCKQEEADAHFFLETMSCP